MEKGSPPEGECAMSFKTIVLIFALCFLTACAMMKERRAMNTPRYEVGVKKGARTCAQCHQEIYDQWFRNSSHALALNTKGFKQLKAEFSDKWLNNLLVGDASCYACHGSRTSMGGVDCETCHGLVIPDEDIKYTHEKKYKPGLRSLQKPDFCAQCHDDKNPMSGEYYRDPYQEWLNSQAAKSGITCQGCHMKPNAKGIRYHGFDSAVLNGDLYQGDLKIREITVDFPTLHLAVENRVSGHSVPTGGPIRTLAMEITLLDRNGRTIHEIVQTFVKRCSPTPLLKAAPYKVISNTQLRSSETRDLSFSLPVDLKDRVYQMRVSFRFYQILPEHQGDLSMAYWIGEPMLQKTVTWETVSGSSESGIRQEELRWPWPAQ
jgi:Cytochrome c7 and related cytochrome c